MSKNSALSSEKSAKSGDGYTLFVYGTFLEEKFWMEKTIKNLGFWADTMFTPIKIFSAVLWKLHFTFSGKWLHLRNSSKTFNVFFKLRSKKLLILGKTARLLKVHFRVVKNNLRQTSSEIKDCELWYFNAQSSITFRMLGLDILKICENCFLGWEELFLLWKTFHSFLQNKIFAKVDWNKFELCDDKKLGTKVIFSCLQELFRWKHIWRVIQKIVFLDSLKHLQTFNGRFSAVWCILYSTCPQILVGKIMLWIKYIFFWGSDRKPSGLWFWTQTFQCSCQELHFVCTEKKCGWKLVSRGLGSFSVVSGTFREFGARKIHFYWFWAQTVWALGFRQHGGNCILRILRVSLVAKIQMN